MKSSTKILSFSSLILAGAVALSGCSGSSSSDASDAGSNDDTANTNDGPQLFGLTPGDSCFDIVSITGTTDDGCMIGVGDTSAMGPVGTALPFNYDMPAGKITVGTNGSLGVGLIANNMGTLLRDGNTMDTRMATCTWHQMDTSTVTITGTNAFTISVTEIESMFADAPACTAATIPATGTCTSKWTWTMKKSTTFTNPPTCQ